MSQERLQPVNTSALRREKLQNFLRMRNSKLVDQSMRPQRNLAFDYRPRRAVQSTRSRPANRSSTGNRRYPNAQRNRTQLSRSYTSGLNDSFLRNEARCQAETRQAEMPMRTNPQLTRAYTSGVNDPFLRNEQLINAEAQNGSGNDDSFLAQCLAEAETDAAPLNTINPTAKRVHFSEHPNVAWINSSLDESAYQDNVVKVIKIVTHDTNIPASTCCKDAQGKLNHVAAINAMKVKHLSKVVQTKVHEFKSMLAENLRLVQSNRELDELSKAAEGKNIRQDNIMDEQETRYRALQEKLDKVQKDLELLEKAGLKYNNKKAADHIIDRLSANYEKMEAETEKQFNEIEHLTEMLEAFEQDNITLSGKLEKLGFKVLEDENNSSQSVSVLNSMVEENTILEEHSRKYQEQIVKTSNSCTAMQYRVVNLTEMTNGMDDEHNNLSQNISRLRQSAANASSLQDSSVVSQDLSYAKHVQNVADDLKNVVQQQDKRIDQLESSFSSVPSPKKRSI
ncbi:hypothetical protein ACHWQZ_G013785 [Mnemiopsis leidyi]